MSAENRCSDLSDVFATSESESAAGRNYCMIFFGRIRLDPHDIANESEAGIESSFSWNSR